MDRLRASHGNGTGWGAYKVVSRVVDSRAQQRDHAFGSMTLG